MTISEFLDSIETTEQEQQFIDAIANIKDDLAQATQVPFVGELFTAILAIVDEGSIESFKQTEHFDTIKDFNISVFDIEKGYFSIWPGPKHQKIILKVAVGICAIILLIYLCRKFCCRRRKEKRI